MLTKKWYEAIAKAVRASTLHNGPHGVPSICQTCLIHELGELFEADNPNFDWGKWEQACGLESEDEPEQAEE